ncbi:hypothetical protein HB364_21100 [Pseudoflavitalea sp. X16]|uniref:hypothetical protein n=1 Tax=Paraflavitalea devenefica TaxID=2716334 RepID=UPI0014242F9E|nr:hypothetical protein [Paraflavitalea devenefica]NII27594.1 hypothetical protein [Paraflavitalea devenefica]
MDRLDLRKLISAITFNQPLYTNYIAEQFANQHQQNHQQFPFWPFQATRRKMAAHYWFRQVLSNFGIILTVGLLITIPFYTDWREVLPSVFMGGLGSFLTLTGFIYLPAFYSNFMPKLDTSGGEGNPIKPGRIGQKVQTDAVSHPDFDHYFLRFLKNGSVSTTSSQ